MRAPLVIIRYTPAGGTDADLQELRRFKPSSPMALVAGICEALQDCALHDPDRITISLLRPDDSETP